MKFMNILQYQNNVLCLEDVHLPDIAMRFGTPCYVYSRATLESNWRQFDSAFGECPHRICYAVKANSNIAILNLLAKLGSGFDIVSVGELERVLIAGGDPKKIVFSGVGKKSEEIIRALEVDIFCFNIESEEELDRIHLLAKYYDKIARIALRVNPNIDAKTHPYIATGLHENKFGIQLDQVLSLCKKISSMPHLKLIGIASHIGSQLTELNPFIEALDCLQQLIKNLIQSGFSLQTINVGGGLGVCYYDETPPAIEQYVSIVKEKMQPLNLEIILEPGRAIVANTGILLTRVEYLKHSHHKNFAIVDAAMNDYMRPALYDAQQRIIPIQLENNKEEKIYDIVGPVCESADFLGKQRKLAIAPGDLLAVCTAGAYGFSMSSNYNSRPRVPEILIDKGEVHLIRQRESIQDLFSQERLI